MPGASHHWPLPLVGALAGAILGLVGAVAYLLVALLIGGLPEIFGPGGLDSDSLIMALAIAGWAVVLAGPLCLIVGGVSGAVIGGWVGHALYATPLRIWLIGTLVCLGMAVIIVILAGLGFGPELIWSVTSILSVWLPLLIFVALGGPGARWLRSHALRRAVVLIGPASDEAADHDHAGEGQAST